MNSGDEMEAVFYWFIGSKGIINLYFGKITKIDKIVNNKDLPPHVFSDSGRETNNFFHLALLVFFRLIFDQEVYFRVRKFYGLVFFLGSFFILFTPKYPPPPGGITIIIQVLGSTCFIFISGTPWRMRINNYKKRKNGVDTSTSAPPDQVTKKYNYVTKFLLKHVNGELNLNCTDNYMSLK